MAEQTLVLEKEIPLEMEGIQVGKVRVQVFEGEPPHIQQGEMNEKYLTVKGNFNDKEYEVKSIRGGIQTAIDELLAVVRKDLSK